MTLAFDASKLFFTADTHFGHAAIIEHSKRPYRNVEQMNDALVQNWNDTVSRNSIVFHLGDVGFTKPHDLAIILSQLHGKIHLVPGNHDNAWPAWFRAAGYFKPQPGLLEIDAVEGEGTKQRITLCHYALRTWNQHHHKAWQLHGHSHGSLTPIGRQMDVGVDPNELKPVSYEQVKAQLGVLPPHENDHHRIQELI